MSSHDYRWSWLLAVAIAIGAPARAFADPKADAKQHIKLATAAHAAGNYDTALKELTLAYALDPQPELLFAIGQVHMKLGDCSTAITFFERFLATSPDASDAATVRKAITSCDTVKPVEPPKPPKPDKPPVPDKAEPLHVEPTRVEPPPIVPPRHAAPSPWYRDGIGDALVLAGVAAGAVAVVMYRSAIHDRDLADRGASYQATQDHLDSARTNRTYAIALSATGGALAAAGLVHYMFHGRHDTEHVAIVPTTRGGMFAWGTRF